MPDHYLSRAVRAGVSGRSSPAGVAARRRSLRLADANAASLGPPS